MASKQFATKIGVIAATVGSAVGLGNVWRFPAETQANPLSPPPYSPGSTACKKPLPWGVISFLNA